MAGVRRRAAPALVLGLALVAGAAGAKATAAGRVGVGVLVLATFATVVFANRRLALTVTIVWLVMLGFTRRILIPFAGWSTHDPLLLFAPLAAVLLWVALCRGPQAEPAPPRSGLLLVVSFLALWSIAQVLNPNQENLVANMQGALLFWVAPLLWFFVARRLTADDHDLVLTAIVATTPIVLFYGLWQTFVGFFPMDLHWVGVAGFGPAIFLPGFKLRPWSVFSSPQEYGVFLAITAMVTLSKALVERRHRWLHLVLFALSGMALFFESSRGTFLTFLAGCFLVVLLRARSVPVTLVAVVFASVFGLVIAGHARPVTTSPGTGTATATGFPPSAAPPQLAEFENGTAANSTPTSSAGPLVQHMLDFFDNPNNSTLAIHEQEVTSAFGRSLANPFGLGAAVGTLAAVKSGSTIPGAESDVANVAEAFGFPGLVAYVALILMALWGSFHLYRRARSARHLAWLGILVVALDQWWQGGLYCTSALVFLVIGGIAREIALERPAGATPASRLSSPMPGVLAL